MDCDYFFISVGFLIFKRMIYKRAEAFNFDEVYQIYYQLLYSLYNFIYSDTAGNFYLPFPKVLELLFCIVFL